MILFFLIKSMSTKQNKTGSGPLRWRSDAYAYTDTHSQQETELVISSINPKVRRGYVISLNQDISSIFTDIFVIRCRATEVLLGSDFNGHLLDSRKIWNNTFWKWKTYTVTCEEGNIRFRNDREAVTHLRP
jgi:hypothetical protein